MKKEEFLKELKKRLKGLPKDDLENRIRFYGEMIDDRIDDGMSEEDAVKEVGTVDEVVAQIAAETPLARLVKERTKPKRSLRTWEIILLILGFPLWFPLALTALILCLVGYLLIWVLDIVVYAVELAFAVASIGSIVALFASMATGQPMMFWLGSAILCAGAAMLLAFGCVGITKATLKVSKRILIGIKTAFLGKGNKNNE